MNTINLEHGDSHNEQESLKNQEFNALQPAYQKLKIALEQANDEGVYEIGFVRLSELHLRSDVITSHFEIAQFPCMDEGGQNSNLYGYIANLAKINLGTPGVFVLENDVQERERRLNLLNNFLYTYNIQKAVIMPHTSCAAAEKALENPVHTKDDVIVKAKSAGKTLEEELISRNSNLSTQIEFLDHLNRNDYHNALVANLCLVNSRSLITRYPRISELALREETQVPAFNNFAIIENELDIQNAASATNLAINIAFGDHGFGVDKFTKENPFLVNIYVATSQEGDNAVDVIRFLTEQRTNFENIRYNIISLTN